MSPGRKPSIAENECVESQSLQFVDSVTQLHKKSRMFGIKGGYRRGISMVSIHKGQTAARKGGGLDLHGCLLPMVGEGVTYFPFVAHYKDGMTSTAYGRGFSVRWCLQSMYILTLSPNPTPISGGALAATIRNMSLLTRKPSLLTFGCSGLLSEQQHMQHRLVP